jgi:hypothetical protein
MFTELLRILVTADMRRALGFDRDLLSGQVTSACPGSVGQRAA